MEKKYPELDGNELNLDFPKSDIEDINNEEDEWLKAELANEDEAALNSLEYPDDGEVNNIKKMKEALEDNEDEVECKVCFDLFPKADCHKTEDGYICKACEQAQHSHQGTNLDLIDADPFDLEYDDPRRTKEEEPEEEKDASVNGTEIRKFEAGIEENLNEHWWDDDDPMNWSDKEPLVYKVYYHGQPMGYAQFEYRGHENYPADEEIIKLAKQLDTFSEFPEVNDSDITWELDDGEWDPALETVEESLKESQSQEIGDTYRRISDEQGIDLDELVYGDDGFMKSCYPEGFPDFRGDVIYSAKYWEEFENWLKETKGIVLKEHINDRPADIESDQENHGVDNAVVDCKKYTLVTHSEDEKPVDCKLEKPALEEPLAGEKVDAKLYEEATPVSGLDQVKVEVERDGESPITVGGSGYVADLIIIRKVGNKYTAVGHTNTESGYEDDYEIFSGADEGYFDTLEDLLKYLLDEGYFDNKDNSKYADFSRADVEKYLASKNESLQEAKDQFTYIIWALDEDGEIDYEDELGHDEKTAIAMFKETVAQEKDDHASFKLLKTNPNDFDFEPQEILSSESLTEDFDSFWNEVNSKQEWPISELKAVAKKNNIDLSKDPTILSHIDGKIINDEPLAETLVEEKEIPDDFSDIIDYLNNDETEAVDGYEEATDKIDTKIDDLKKEQDAADEAGDYDTYDEVSDEVNTLEVAADTLTHIKKEEQEHKDELDGVARNIKDAGMDDFKFNEAYPDVPFDSEAKEGDTIRIIHLEGEDNSYDGKVGKVDHIDGIGQLHGTWGGLAVIPGVDDFVIVEDESLEEAKRAWKSKYTDADWDWFDKKEQEFETFAKQKTKSKKSVGNDPDEMLDLAVSELGWSTADRNKFEKMLDADLFEESLNEDVLDDFIKNLGNDDPVEQPAEQSPALDAEADKEIDSIMSTWESLHEDADEEIKCAVCGEMAKKSDCRPEGDLGLICPKCMGHDDTNESLKEAKEPGDKEASYDAGLKLAALHNKPVIYGYSNKARNGKFFALDDPIICDNVFDETKKFKAQYKNSGTVYVAYPGDYVEESLTEDADVDYVEYMHSYCNALEPHMDELRKIDNVEELKQAILNIVGEDSDVNNTHKKNKFTWLVKNKNWASPANLMAYLDKAMAKARSIEVKVFDDGELVNSNKPLTPAEKMELLNSGLRGFNPVICSDGTLERLAKICKDNGYDKALAVIEDEIAKRSSGNTHIREGIEYNKFSPEEQAELGCDEDGYYDRGRYVFDNWCGDIFDESDCRYEVDFGWLCPQCQAALKSHGETLTFIENESLTETMSDEAGIWDPITNKKIVTFSPKIETIWKKVIKYANDHNIDWYKPGLTTEERAVLQKRCIEAACTPEEIEALRIAEGDDGKIYSAYSPNWPEI